uniref:NEDD8-activating enzyme E1 regulatory subunit n=1 Tax=Trieres chinensis TaxID=1514140 RepID=A0A7S2E762_TRICV
MSELNPDVPGTHVSIPSFETADFGSLLDDAASAAAAASEAGAVDGGKRRKIIAVASDLDPDPLLALSRACHDASVPLVIVRSYGLLGTVRVQVRRHRIVESKPDNSVPDLRLADPNGIFPSLRKLVDGADLDGMDSKEHGHVPFVIILIKAMDKWRDGLKEGRPEGVGAPLRFPQTPDEKAEFRDLVKSMARKYNDELNFQEAVSDAYLAYARKDVPWEVAQLLERAERAQSPGAFDLLAVALKRFMDGNGGQPPLNGSIPDMTAATDPYVALQGAYKAKAEEDRAEMRRILEGLRLERGGATPCPEVSEEELTTFCRNVHNLRGLGTRSYAEEFQAHSGEGVSEGDDDGDAPMPSAAEAEIRDDLMMATMDPYEVPEHTPLLWHVALRACDVFRRNHGRYPGSDGRTTALDSDATEVQGIIGRVAKSMGLADTDLIKSTLLSGERKHAREVVRYNNAEIHNVAAVVGGVASQEAVKLITGQYVPLDDTYVYNGIAGIAGVYRF